MLAEEWKENFRMDKDNFYKLCGELRHATSGLSRNTGGLDFVLFVRRRTTQDEAQRPENEIAGLDRFRVNPSKPCRFRCGFQVMKPFPLETASV